MIMSRLHSLRGFIADSLHGAMKEAQAVSRGTKCKQFLFLTEPESAAAEFSDGRSIRGGA
jgi:hypothetical protein